MPSRIVRTFCLMADFAYFLILEYFAALDLEANFE
jgi:hypothetical protein